MTRTAAKRILVSFIQSDCMDELDIFLKDFILQECPELREYAVAQCNGDESCAVVDH